MLEEYCANDASDWCKSLLCRDSAQNQHCNEQHTDYPHGNHQSVLADLVHCDARGNGA